MAREKDTRLFIRLDLDYADHPKIIGLSDAAFRAHVTMMLYSRKYMTDGVLPKPVANRLGSQWDTDVLSELQNNDPEAPSLVLREDGSYELHGFTDMQETRAEIDARTARNRENGAKGGRPRKPKETQSVTGSGGDSGTQTKAETETETETEVSSKELTTRARESFESAWSHWPKKTEKKKSLEQFVRVAKSNGVDAATSWVVAFGDAYARTTETQYVPALAVWLRNERWTDALPQPRRRDTGPTRAEQAWEFVNGGEIGVQGNEAAVRGYLEQ
ncbi:hypothetical protein ACIFOC_00392 [Leucobacter aridicollis]|uniref:hypothetical protein n=1 Tax=Leucobacter aridicollis TaxID=283878 RepID=UPI0037CA2909